MMGYRASVLDWRIVSVRNICCFLFVTAVLLMVIATFLF